MQDIISFITDASVWVIPVVIAITFHEAAHGWVADRLGDDTARRRGRVTLNPLRHIDRFGTILLPALLILVKSPFVFGYAKPVPVNFARLNHPKRDMVWVALAGPGANILLALASGLLLHLVTIFPEGIENWLGANLEIAILINVVLAVFNMLPLPPLDGGRVMVGLLPVHLAVRYARIERYGFMILIGVIFFLPMLAGQFGFDFDPWGWLVWPPVEFVIDSIVILTGHG
jgi:Zn-dependent protease